MNKSESCTCGRCEEFHVKIAAQNEFKNNLSIEGWKLLIPSIKYAYDIPLRNAAVTVWGVWGSEGGVWFQSVERDAILIPDSNDIPQIHSCVIESK